MGLCLIRRRVRVGINIAKWISGVFFFVSSLIQPTRQINPFHRSRHGRINESRLYLSENVKTSKCHTDYNESFNTEMQKETFSTWIYDVSKIWRIAQLTSGSFMLLISYLTFHSLQMGEKKKALDVNRYSKRQRTTQHNATVQCTLQFSTMQAQHSTNHVQMNHEC